MEPPEVVRRSGFASRRDLDDPEFDAAYRKLEEIQREFALASPRFREPQYRWDTDSLHNWSRVWEYPFTFLQLAAERARYDRMPVAIDFGSGSTFFQLAAARLGIELICFDNDPVVVHDLENAAAQLAAAPGSIDVRLNDSHTLPLETARADFGYSVSVIEHMEHPAPLIAELARVVKPGGLFILTLDVDVEGHAGLTAEAYESLRSQLSESFDWVYPDRAVHPRDMLTSANSPLPRPGERAVPGLMLRDNAGKMRPLIGGPNPDALELAVYACVLRRKRDA